MKKIYIIPLLILVTAMAIADVMYEGGKAGRTGSPGEFDCTGCHTSFAVNTGPGSISISSPNLTNWEYVLGQTYQIDVTVTQTGMPLFGFGFEALTNSNNNAGTFVITNTVQTKILAANISGVNRNNVVHKKDGGLTNDTHTFSFNWTAPATNVGNVKFYAAGNASDNQGDSLGDYVYKTTQLVIPFTTGNSELSINESIKVFPNPAHDFIKVDVRSDASTLAYQLMDCNGRVVMNETRDNRIANTILSIALPKDLSNGIYFLKTTDGNNKSAMAKVFVYN